MTVDVSRHTHAVNYEAAKEFGLFGAETSVSCETWVVSERFRIGVNRQRCEECSLSWPKSTMCSQQGITIHSKNVRQADF